MQRLLVNADDFGLSEGINRGIIEAHQRGIVTSASLMPTAWAFDAAVYAARENPGLSLGVHLTLVEEDSLTGIEIPKSYVVLAKALLRGKIRAEQLRGEMAAQIKRCLDAGVKLTHIDTHQHVHLLPQLLPLVIELAKEHEIPRIRVPLDTPRAGSRFFGKLVLCQLSRSALSRVRTAGLDATDHARGLFESGSLNEEKLLRLLERLPQGTTELMCHPGYEDDMTRQAYAHWKFHWEDEVKALTSARVIERVRAINSSCPDPTRSTGSPPELRTR
jgi:predicted glycoside hydrolase/deacetylase ChbG (UPF0249 family)